MRRGETTRKVMAMMTAAVLALGAGACGGTQGTAGRAVDQSTLAARSPDVDDTATAPSASATLTVTPADITPGTTLDRGFIDDNVYHSAEYGDIHYSSYIPAGYDGSEPYALFVTLPGWEGLYFQGVGKNMQEDFGVEAPHYNSRMIVLSTQLNDWGETSANQAIALTEYFLDNYNIDRSKVYLHGYSGGGETGSIVMGKRPDLFTAYLCCATKWDGDQSVLVAQRTPVYLVVGESDSYYGSGPLKDAYSQLHDAYRDAGLSEDEIDRILVLDVKDARYFTDRGFTDQHAGGQTFAHDESIMGWLFGEH